MKLKQLQCIAAVVQSNFSVTAAAEKLHLSQPAVSKQIKLAEELLGLPVFRRNSKALVGLTEVGEAMMPDIERIMVSMEHIIQLSQHHNMFALTQLSIATTHTLAHNRLVQILPAIQHEYPQLPMNIIEGTNAQVLQMVQERDADFAWFSASDLTPYNPLLRGVFMLPAESWSAVAIVPQGHEMTKKPFEGLTSLAPYPLITYITSHKEPSALAKAMAGRGLSARVVLTARNAEMIKNYVRQGLGVGVIADMAFDASATATSPCSRWTAGCRFSTPTLSGTTICACAAITMISLTASCRARHARRSNSTCSASKAAASRAGRFKSYLRRGWAKIAAHF